MFAPNVSTFQKVVTFCFITLLSKKSHLFVVATFGANFKRALISKRNFQKYGEMYWFQNAFL